MNANATYHIFLSYNSLDRPIVLRVAEELEKRGCSCFLDQWYLQPGHDWVAALEQALASSRSAAMFIGQEDMGRWQQRERAWVLDRNAEDSSFAVVPVLLPGCKPPLGFLKQLMWIDLRQDPTAAGQLDALAATGRGKDVDREGLKEPRATICPYRGLLYFREEDAAFFFGRDKYVDELVQKVEQRTLVAVVGASGSGKSSVVRAGLVPRLRSRDKSPVWEIVTMLPGERNVAARCRTAGGCSTCMVTFWNGARIGMPTTKRKRQQIHKGRKTAPTGCSGAAVGTTPPCAAGAKGGAAQPSVEDRVLRRAAD